MMISRVVPAVAAALLVGLGGAASAQAGPPTGDALGDRQQFDVAAYPPVAGAPVIFDLQQTYWNVLGVRPRAPREVVIRFPRGAKWNGRLFPKCDRKPLAARGPAACPRGSKFATAQVTVALGTSQTTTIQAKMTDFVGTRLHGHPTQLFWVVPEIGAPLLITAEVIPEPRGPYGLALHIGLSPLLGAAANAPPSEGADFPGSAAPLGVIVSIRNVDLTRTLVKPDSRGHPRKVALIAAPLTCNGRWHYAFESVFLTGPPLVSKATQPCVRGAAASSPGDGRPASG